MSPNQSVEQGAVDVGRVGRAVGAGTSATVPPPPPAPPALPPRNTEADEVGGSRYRRSDDPPPPPPAPDADFRQAATQPHSLSGPPPPPPGWVAHDPRTENLDEPDSDFEPENTGPGSTSYELDLLERKADHTAARLGAHRAQLDVIRSGSKEQFRVEFGHYVDIKRRGMDESSEATETPVRFPTPNKVGIEHAELLKAAALLVRSGWVSPKLLEELDQLQAELHQGVCDLRQERSYARRRSWDGSPEIERQAERLSERVHSPRVERVERRARRVLARASIPWDFEQLAKEYRRDFTDYSATMADIVAEVGGASTDESLD